jgi:hypothetical protein
MKKQETEKQIEDWPSGTGHPAAYCCISQTGPGIHQCSIGQANQFATPFHPSAFLLSPLGALGVLAVNISFVLFVPFCG